MVSKTLDKRVTNVGSYKEDDCVFLLKDVSGLVQEQSNEEREKAIQNGKHYSEMLPIEYMPTEEYIKLFHESLKESAFKIAKYVGIVSELIYKEKGNDVILVSLARAGSPIGVLIKRYLKFKYNLNAPHYSISIIRDKGIDVNAIKYIVKNHGTNIQFIDGWTGKGVISQVLLESCEELKEKYSIELDPTLAVLADPSHCSSLYGTREDFLIPSACLNSTVSGLVSRTFLDTDIIGEDDFHGAKYYKEWEDKDLSNYYVDEVSKHFKAVEVLPEDLNIDKGTPNLGMKDVLHIQNEFDIRNINLVKPGVGETTRVLLRRVPWKILVDDINNPNLKHILLLAEDRNVEVMEYKDMNYSCCGLIKDMSDY